MNWFRRTLIKILGIDVDALIKKLVEELGQQAEDVLKEKMGEIIKQGVDKVEDVIKDKVSKIVKDQMSGKK